MIGKLRVKVKYIIFGGNLTGFIITVVNKCKDQQIKRLWFVANSIIRFEYFTSVKLFSKTGCWQSDYKEIPPLLEIPAIHLKWLGLFQQDLVGGNVRHEIKICGNYN